MNDCETFEADLVDAASGELAATRRAPFDAHLAGCDACRTELASLRETLGTLDRTAARPGDFELSGFALRAADRAEGFRDRTLDGAWWSLRRPARFALAISVAAFAGALVLVSLPATVPPPDVGEAPEPLVADAALDNGEAADDLSLDSAFDALEDDDLEQLGGALDFVAYVDPS